MEQYSILSALRSLFGRLSAHRRRALAPLMALMLAGAVAEVVTIGALLPFLAVIADPQGSPVLAIVAPLLDLIGVREGKRAIFLLAGLFGIAALLAAALRLALLWTSNNFVNGVSYELAMMLYTDALHRPYVWHAERNSSEIIAGVNKVQIVTVDVLAPLMQGTIAVVIAGFIVAGLIVIDPVVALVAGVGFSAIYLATTVATRPRLKRNSGIISRAQGRRIKSMQEGLGGIRDVLIDQSQPVFIEDYERAEAGFRDARTKNAFLANSPRYVVEAVGMILIVLLAMAVVERPGGLLQAVPVLGALALGAQKLLPLIQQVYNGWARAMGNRQVLFDLAASLHEVGESAAPCVDALPFRKSICLDNVGFSYSSGRVPALSGVSLDVPKGARVGIAGKTGSGKSTLMDLILGLLEPSAGKILIDDVKLSAANRLAWQKNIAHVPQFIYLADVSIAENIAFGVRPTDIDLARVRRSAERAELAGVIAALPEGYATRIGERGIQLSGGQRQRIGIARALYKEASVLIFDEATSALDNETESAVMNAIDHLDRNLTIFIIAHRLSTLGGCDLIVQLEAGQAKKTEYLRSRS